MNCTVMAKCPLKKDFSTVHTDNTSRVQTVTKNSIKFYDLIKNLKLKTGVPVVINTNFNLKGQPIVETPRDAIMTFGSGIDILIMGSYVVF